MTLGATAALQRRVWLRSAWWDAVCLGFCWVPFYVWVVFGLGLGQHAWGLEPLGRPAAREAMLLATTIALGTTYIHRHYTLLLVYGDRATFSKRAKQFIAAPLVLLGCIALARWGKGVELFTIYGQSFTSWGMIVLVGTVWNIWHAIQQRYGIMRAYAGRCAAGLETRDHAKRDFWLLWALVALVVVLVLSLQRNTFTLHSSTYFVERKLGPFLDGPAFRTVVGLAAAAAAGAAALWLRHELRAKLRSDQRAPRIVYAASTLTLLGVFVFHGPIVGYLCFGVAHALEYLAFVHHYGQRRWGGEQPPAALPGPHAARPGRAPLPQSGTRTNWRGLAALLFQRPAASAPLLIAGFVLLFVVLRQYKGTDLYVVYYITTSFLHFLYDGWIWKVGKRDVAKPLGIQPATP